MRSINHPLASILPILWHEVGRRFQCFRALSSEKKKKKKDLAFIGAAFSPAVTFKWIVTGNRIWLGVDCQRKEVQ